MTSGVFIFFGIFFLIPSLFFFFPELSALLFVVSSEEADDHTKKTYSAFAKALLIIGTLLILTGVVIAFYSRNVA